MHTYKNILLNLIFLCASWKKVNERNYEINNHNNNES